MGKLLGAQIGNFHTLKDWGLYLKVGSPKSALLRWMTTLCRCRGLIPCST